MRMRQLFGTAAILALFAQSAVAETTTLRLSTGYSTAFLPVIIAQQNGLIEKHARASGLGDLKVNWALVDGGNVITDALLSGAVDVAGIGVPAFATLWSKTVGTKQEVRALSAVSTTSVYINTRNPNIHSLKDFGPQDRIAVPGIKTSAAAMMLQMAVEKELGTKNYDKLDVLTVSLPHPEAVQALLSGRSEINSHAASPPFSSIERRDPRIHTVVNTSDAIGGAPTVIIMVASVRFCEANPRSCAAVVAALDEANAIIAKDRRAAAQIYVAASKSGAKIEDVMDSLDDPGSQFSTTPTGVMKFFEFMERAGLIKTKPASWRDVFFASAHGLHGS